MFCMKIKYDPQGDVLYFEFRDSTVTTKRVTDDIAIDYDADGNVAGVEILDARRNVLHTTKKFSVEFEGITPTPIAV